jgi:hypothetical protein
MLAGSCLGGSSPARRFTSSSLYHGPNLGAEGVEREGFREHVHASVKKIAPERGVLGISGNEEYLQIRSRGAGDFRQLPGVDMRQHDVAQTEVDDLIVKFWIAGRASDASRTL